MPKMKIAKSKHIQAPVKNVYEIVSDFHHWPKWSPWLIMEPGVKVSIHADGKSYDWEGKRIGSGNMQVLKEDVNKSITYDLNFVKPWKSHAKVKFEIQPKDNGTLVSWHMDSSLPIFMFWMKKSMETYVGMDYERGLSLLKDYAEDGEIHSSLNFLGTEDFRGADYLGIRRQTTMKGIGPDMQEDFGKLGAIALDFNTDMTQSFSIYHKYDAVKDIVEYTAGIKVAQKPEILPSGIHFGNLRPAKLYTLEHIGPYEHLGNAWSTMHTMIRNREIKVVKGYHPFETYGNSPEDTPPIDLITRIHFAVK